MYKQPGSDQVSGGGGIRRGRHVEARPAPAPAFFQTAPLHVALGSHGPFFQKQPILKKIANWKEWIHKKKHEIRNNAHAPNANFEMIRMHKTKI